MDSTSISSILASTNKYYFTYPSIRLFFSLSLFSEICDNPIFVLFIALILSTVTQSLTDSSFYDWYISCWSFDKKELCEIWGDDSTA